MHNALTATSRRRREPSSAPAKVRVCRSRRIQWCISTAGAAVVSFLLASPRRSLPLFRSGLSSLSLSLTLALSFLSLRAAYSRRRAKACTLSTYSVRCAGALSARVYKAASPAIPTPHTKPRNTWSPSDFALRLPSVLFLPSVRAKDATPGYNLLPLNPRAKQSVVRNANI